MNNSNRFDITDVLRRLLSARISKFYDDASKDDIYSIVSFLLVSNRLRNTISLLQSAKAYTGMVTATSTLLISDTMDLHKSLFFYDAANNSIEYPTSYETPEGINSARRLEMFENEVKKRVDYFNSNMFVEYEGSILESAMVSRIPTELPTFCLAVPGLPKNFSAIKCDLLSFMLVVQEMITGEKSNKFIGMRSILWKNLT